MPRPPINKHAGIIVKVKKDKEEKKASTQQASKQFYCYPMGNETEIKQKWRTANVTPDFSVILETAKICVREHFGIYSILKLQFTHIKKSQFLENG